MIQVMVGPAHEWWLGCVSRETHSAMVADLDSPETDSVRMERPGKDKEGGKSDQCCTIIFPTLG